tara:strand:- start:35 stop:715 length:681 start_codon:yes stop_codon:yes gene_type:complete
MTSEDQINQGLNSDSGSEGESAEELYPDSPAKISEDAGGSNEKKASNKQGLYPSKPSKQVKASNFSRAPVTHSALPTNQRSQKRQPTSYYHPNDYYLGTDWPRLIVGTLASLILLVSVGILALYLFDRFESDTITPQTVVTSDGESSTINAYLCAGDGTPVKQIDVPPSALFSGKNAAGTWIAFQDPVAPSVQLWSRAADLTASNLDNLEVVNCENLDGSKELSDD